MAARRKPARKRGRSKKAARRREVRRPRRATKKPRKRAAKKPRKRVAKPSRRRAAASRTRRSVRKPRAAKQAVPAPAQRAERASRPRDRRLVAGAAVEVGVVVHYFPKPGAAVVALSRPLHQGDHIHVRGHTTDFVQLVTGLALDGTAVAAAAPPQEVGVALANRARAGDRVFRVSW